jgi:hypothetical protein
MAAPKDPGLTGQPKDWEIDPYTGRPQGYAHRLPESPSNGRDPLSGLPWQVRAVTLLGVPSVIALAAVYWIATGVQTTMLQNQQLIVEVRQAEQLHDQNVRAKFSTLERQGEVLTRLLRSICQSVAKTDNQRDKCSE